jgi:hypothetical protein
LIVTILSVSALGAGRARAETSTQEKALASRLFDDASKLMSAGQAAAACPKYAESERLDAQLGTLLHLGECYAKIGKTASAWASFKEAADIAAQRNDPRSAKIKERLDTIAKTVSNLVIVVADSEPATLEVREDGAVVGRAGWGTPIPSDPGEHKITANAPGAKPRELSATVADGGQTVTVRLPAIEYLPEPVAAPEPATSAPAPAAQNASVTPQESRSWFATHRKLVGGIVGGVGIVGFGVGTAFGLMVKPTYDKSKSHCNGDHCDAIGHDDRQSAFSKATVSDIAFGVGAAALVGGAVLWLTAPSNHPGEQPPSATITPIVGPQTAFVSVQRSW